MSNQDKTQKVRIVFRFLFEIYKILTSTLLIFFVPQKCDDGTRLCSFTENFNRIDPYNTFVLYFNITTSIFFFVYYLIEIYRERVYIQLLDIDYTKDEDYYYEEVKEYPKIKAKINEINYLFYNFNILLIIIFLLNIIVSIVVLTNYYLNDLTIFIAITNTIIILDKLLRSFFIAKKSWNEKKAYSMYTVKDVTFNTIDKTIKKRRRKRRRKKLKEKQEKQNVSVVIDN